MHFRRKRTLKVRAEKYFLSISVYSLLRQQVSVANGQ
jgi:hypothetical protein